MRIIERDNKIYIKIGLTILSREQIMEFHKVLLGYDHKKKELNLKSFIQDEDFQSEQTIQTVNESAIEPTNKSNNI